MVHICWITGFKIRLLGAKSVLEDGLNEKFLFIGIYFISKKWASKLPDGLVD